MTPRTELRDRSAPADTSRLSPPPPATGLAGLSAAVAAVVFVLTALLGGSIARAGEGGPWSPGLLVGALGILSAAGVTWYAVRGLLLARAAQRTDTDGDRLGARALAARSRAHSFGALSGSFALLLVLGLLVLLTANDSSVITTFFNVEYMALSAADIAGAFTLNVVIAVSAMALVLVFGLVLAVLRMLPGDGARPLRSLAIAYIDVARAIPSIIMIYLIGFGLPLSGFAAFSGLPPAWYAIIALTLTYSAYVAEIYRAGIEAVHPSQSGAARALGLSYGRTLRFVVLPQAVRAVVPPLLSAFIALQKDTALVNIIGAVDAFNQAKFFASSNFNLSSVSVVAVLFVLITIPQARLVDWLLARTASRRGRSIR